MAHKATLVRGRRHVGRGHSFLLEFQMTGPTKISCGERPIILLLTRHLVRTLRGKFWAWW
jgi:hypothetical protein